MPAFLRSLLVLLFLTLPLFATAQDTLTSRSGPLFDELARMDSLVFDASFVACDYARADTLFAADVEFVHDETGFQNSEVTRANTKRLTENCPADNGVTRTVVPGSLDVYPIANYGAVQTGRHRFDERGAATSTVARFVHLWHRTDRGWKLARILSFDHRPVPAESADGSR